MNIRFHHLLLLSVILFFTACGPVDPRNKLFDEDDDKLGTISLTEDKDTLAQQLAALFRVTVNEDLKPSEFSYHTRVSDDGERLLVLVKMPKLKKVEKSARTEVVGIVQSWHEMSPTIANKKLYLGVKGNYTYMITKAPGQEAENRLIAAESDLYDFYGPREKFETEAK